MRLPLHVLACTALSALASGQNHFEIWSGCTNFASRVPIGNVAGEMLIRVPASHFAGIAHDASGFIEEYPLVEEAVENALKALKRKQ
jgi:hypothetical protein